MYITIDVSNVIMSWRIMELQNMHFLWKGRKLVFQQIHIRKCVMQILTSNIDNMYWGRILKAYLEEGIEYEEEQEGDSLTEVVNQS